MLMAARPTMMPEIIDSHGNGISGVLIDDVVVNALVVVDVPGEAFVAEVCTVTD